MCDTIFSAIYSFFTASTMANIDKAKRQKKPNFSDRELSIMLESISENYDAIASKQQNVRTRSCYTIGLYGSAH